MVIFHFKQTSGDQFLPCGYVKIAIEAMAHRKFVDLPKLKTVNFQFAKC